MYGLTCNAHRWYLMHGQELIGLTTMNTGLCIADYTVIATFFAVMVGVGLYYSRRSRSSDQFFGNDKTVPWWLSGVSFYMNSFSALAFVMYSALAYKFGWVPVTVSWLSVPAVLPEFATLLTE